MSVRQHNKLICDYNGCNAQTKALPDSIEDLRGCAELYGWYSEYNVCSDRMPRVDVIYDYCPLHTIIRRQEKPE